MHRPHSTPATKPSIKPGQFAASVERDYIDNPPGIEKQYSENLRAARRDGIDLPNELAFRFSDLDTRGGDERYQGLEQLLTVVAKGNAPFGTVYAENPERLLRWRNPTLHYFVEQHLQRCCIQLVYRSGHYPMYSRERGISPADKQRIEAYIRENIGGLLNDESGIE